MSQDVIANWIYPSHLKQLKIYMKYMKQQFSNMKQQATQGSGSCERRNRQGKPPSTGCSAGKEKPG